MVIEKDFVEEVAQAVLPSPVALPVVFPEAFDQETKPTCQHHWVIETANGPISWGECQVCHEVKEFQNSISDADIGY
ncbi:MAG: hypothetical protein HQ475_00290 [SAR202 cluster bacterium]|nr:hypothetical protein [SAR202 cluster bacterium]